MLTLTVDRIERVENKAMGTLLGVAVAIALFSVTTGILGSDGPFADASKVTHLVAAALLFAAMLYLFGSGFLALEAYKVGQVFRPNLNDRAPLADEAHEKMMILYCIEQNERSGLLRSNRLSAAFSWLIRGLATVLLLGFVTIVVTARELA